MNILVSVMNWGLGHATRCIPIINSLAKLGHSICIASDGYALELLKKEFPEFTFYALPSYNIKYSRNIAIAMIQQAPNMLLARTKEYKITQEIIKSEQIRLIISDQRYGCFNKHIKSVFITHQVHLPLKGLEKAVGQRVHDQWMSSFDEIWVPDNQTTRLAKDLSAPHQFIKTNYLGIVSRFSDLTIEKYNSGIDYLTILSGPEPNRTHLEELLTEQLQDLNRTCVLVRGVVEGELNAPTIKDKLTIYNYCNQKLLNALIKSAAHIITRSGYTTLMDLAALKKSATLIPTEGQAEQIYLAQLVQSNGWSDVQSINDFRIHEVNKASHAVWPSVNTQRSLMKTLSDLIK